MFTVLTCIQQQHDLRLVLLAAIICLASAFTAFAGYRRAMRGVGGFRLGWASFTGLVGGAGVWATHFIAMLAYQPALTIRYEPLTTALSLALSILALAGAFHIAASRRTAGGRAMSGAVAGLGVSVMHFTGMAAVRTQADLVWRPEFVVAAVILGMAGGAVEADMAAALVSAVGPAAGPSEDYRVLVAGGAARAAMTRRGTNWINNVAQGARCLPAPDDAELMRMAEAAAAALDMDYAGVDLMRDRDGRLAVLEVNSIPAWRGLQTVASQDIARILVEDFPDRHVEAGLRRQCA